jgi:uncharacterized protein YukE
MVEAQILVKPTELRSSAVYIRQRTKSIQQSLNTVDRIIRSIDPSVFDGNRAASLRNRYSALRDKILRWPVILEQFSTDLENAADLFKKADEKLDSKTAESLTRPNDKGDGKIKSSSSIVDQSVDTIEAALSTIKLFIKKNPLFESIGIVVGGLDFFLRKMPTAERAFKAWEDYNNSDLSQWNSQRSHELEQEARKALDELGLGTVKDTLSLLTDTLGENKIIGDAIVKIKDVAFTATEWVKVLDNDSQK